MKLLELPMLEKVCGGTAGGGTGVPELPPRGDEQTNSADGSYQPAPLPVESDEG